MQAPRDRWYQRFRPRFVISICIIMTIFFEFSIISKTNFEPSTLLHAKVAKDMDSEAWKHLTNESTYDNIAFTPAYNSTVNFYPSDLLHSPISAPFPMEESAFYVDLMGRCTNDRDSIIHINRVKDANGLPQASIVSQNDPDLLDKLRDCTEFDVYLPAPLRRSGYCEDGLAYVRGLDARIMPRWVFTEKFYGTKENRHWHYNELCPNSILIFFNHYWDGLLENPGFPESKPVYLMPNIEMYELRETHMWRVDAVFCKTLDGYLRIRKWYQQEGNPRNTRLFYTRHTSTDIAAWARYNNNTIPAKDYKSLNFIHTAGTSVQKSTYSVVQCWLQNPSLPSLHVHTSPDKMQMFSEFEDQIATAKNIQLHLGRLSTKEFARLIAQSAAFVCPSKMEGYGHYINQARASGGVIVTTDYPPMNELISAESGVMVSTTPEGDVNAFFGGSFIEGHGLRHVPSSAAHVTWQEICAATQDLMDQVNVMQRLVMAQEAKLRYAFDTRYFLYKMNQVKEHARRQMKKRKLND